MMHQSRDIAGILDASDGGRWGDGAV